MNANAKSLITAAALAIIGTSATAFEAIGQQYPQASTLTRAEVTAELVRARQAGQTVQTAEPYSQVDAMLVASRNSNLSRAEVRRELARSLNHDDYVAANEAYGGVVAGSTTSARSDAAE